MSAYDTVSFKKGGERWRYEIERDNAASQRQAVLTFLAEVAELDQKNREDFIKEHKPYDDMGGLTQEEYDNTLVDMNRKYWGQFKDGVEKKLLILELTLADKQVLSQARSIRTAFNADGTILASNKNGKYPNPYKNPFFNSPSSISPNMEKALEKLKETAINRLHPTPLETPAEQPRRLGTQHEQDSLPSGHKDNQNT
ncbi:hypothetical protein [Corynebacterium lowii]|uniref:Uncharacterized protein n=1 Tax=Corynebacterium lowii TaxID=1544413 RepID=A0A0Q1ABD7_9CORY|nr:hypothetical protein [Corynebacterium lowii]KQB83997.1 hypothetical protein Clow_02198 [Corynebacterium lowii]MDP9852753.1 hypothetical protein [Corynebacterium lowii]